MKSILQDWVTTLGLRHQGVLLTAVRGCDTAPKHDPSKLLSRYYRSVILNAHCGHPKKAQTFIEHFDVTDMETGGDLDQVHARFDGFRRNLDHYPHHYIAHVMHAAEIVGFKHPDEGVRLVWRSFYFALCRGFHLSPETEDQLDERLNADEETFGSRDRAG